MTRIPRRFPEPPTPAISLPTDPPATLLIDGAFYDFAATTPDPCAPYARRADAGGQRLLVGVALIRCPTCGDPLFRLPGSDLVSQFRCGRPACTAIYKLQLVREPGRGPMAAMVRVTS